MNLAKYCKEKGMSKEQYNNFRNNITETANAIKNNTPDTKGLYYPVNNILSFLSNNDMRRFVIQELKKLGFEFIEDYTLYRT